MKHVPLFSALTETKLRSSSLNVPLRHPGSALSTASHRSSIFSDFTQIDAHLEQLKKGMEDVPHSRRAFTATVVKVTGTEGRGGGVGKCNPEWPPVYTCNFLEFLYICSSHLHVHIAWNFEECSLALYIKHVQSYQLSPSTLLPPSPSHAGLSSFVGDFLSLSKAPVIQVCNVGLIIKYTCIFMSFKLSLCSMYTCTCS